MSENEQGLSWRERLFGRPEGAGQEGSVPATDAQPAPVAQPMEVAEELPNAAAAPREQGWQPAEHSTVETATETPAPAPEHLSTEAADATVTSTPAAPALVEDAASVSETPAAAAGSTAHSAPSEPTRAAPAEPQVAEQPVAPEAPEEYRPEADTGSMEIEPMLVQAASLRGETPMGEQTGAGPELVEPPRTQPSARRQAIAIEDALAAERAVSEDAEPAPAASQPEARAEEIPVTEPEAAAAEPAPLEEELEATQAMDAVEVSEREPETAVTTATDDPTVAPVAAAAAIGGAETETRVLPVEEPAAEPFVFVDDAERPYKHSTRGTGFLVTLLSTVIFAGLLALAAFLVQWLFAEQFDESIFTTLWLKPYFILPVAVFFLAYWITTAIVNRAGWWAHVLGGFIVALLVYAATVVGLMMAGTAPNDWAIAETDFSQENIAAHVLAPLAVLSFVIAREMPIWFGGIVSRRGRTQKERYEREMAEYRDRLDGADAVIR